MQNYQMLAAYNAWANRLLYAAVGELSAEELERVLSYPAVQRAWSRLGTQQDSPVAVLQWFGQHTRHCELPPPSGLRCHDRDDQIFIDLAVAHGAGGVTCARPPCRPPCPTPPPAWP
mgnify:CR=1 FL=1